MILGIIFISIVYVWNESRNKRRKQLEEIKMDQVRSQLETLKSQINPHFLFNSFNTLVSIIESKPDQAVTFVEKLSDFYRNMLQFRDKDLIPLNDELEINQNYSFLLDQRFGNTVQIRTNIVNNDWLIIPLTLQILTENAVKHNAASKVHPLIISITCENDTLKVSNNIQTRRTTEKSTHFGLQSLAKRYLNITGKEIIVLVTQQQFCITIPLIKNKS
jgi:LytS/YehU family sensor histidine kinase